MAHRFPAEMIGAICAELEAHLDSRFRELNAEIRHYPTPIARCDDQLPKLIEQRDHARAELERIRALVASVSAGDPLAALHASRRFLDSATVTDDEAEMAVRKRLTLALSAES